ncbi:hypothetical protein [Cytobacillus firmus]|uniref:hypothetical protein n=1 Tax=Cytobacillus firmus TaxID=1399 RepID=UPI0021C7A70E|nr:hypothetical protein [Cytobacillus firmus]
MRKDGAGALSFFLGVLELSCGRERTEIFLTAHIFYLYAHKIAYPHTNFGYLHINILFAAFHRGFAGILLNFLV